MKKTEMIMKHYTTAGYSNEETIEIVDGTVTAREYAEGYDEITDLTQDDYFGVLVARVLDDEDPTEIIAETEVTISAEGLRGESKYVFNRREDGDGEMKVFETAEEAIDYAEKDWNHLTAKEQRRIKDDPAGEFFVGIHEMVWDSIDEAYYPAADPDDIIVDMLESKTIALDTMTWDETVITESLLAAYDNLDLEDAKEFIETIEKNVNTRDGIQWDIRDKTVELDWDKTEDDFVEAYGEEFTELAGFMSEYKEAENESK